MKKVLYILVLSLIVGLSACNDFLNEDPKSNVSVESFYKNSNHVRSSLNAVYAAAFSDVNSCNWVWLNEVTADDIAVYVNTTQGPVADRVALEQVNYHSELQYFKSAWASAYVTISRANELLERTNLTDSVSRSYKADARFWRAFSYFNLVRWFGDVPLITSIVRPERANFYSKRDSSTLIYKQIIEDLRFASKYCVKKKYAHSDVKNGGRVTQAGAMAYLAKVYMTMAGYPMNDSRYLTNAMDTLVRIRDNKATYGYDFMPVYADIFDLSKYETNTENMVYIQGAGNEFLKTNMSGFFYSTTYVRPTKEVAEGTNVFAFDQNTPDSIPMRADLRRATAFKVVGNDGAGGSVLVEPDASAASNGIYIGKWIDFAQKDYPRNDFATLRYSEVILLYDELVCTLQDASKRANVVADVTAFRKRGGFYDPIKVKNGSWDELMAEVKLERRRDLLFEGHRRLDLVRWGNYIATKKKSLAFQFSTLDNVWDYINDNHWCLFPIPLHEFDVNNLLGEQNPGYGGR